MDGFFDQIEAAGDDDTDLLSLQLAISLQLEDISSVLASRKGKGRAGDPVSYNDITAFDIYQNHLSTLSQTISDNRLARSISTAVLADQELISEIARVEREAERDREFALRISSGSSQCSSDNYSDERATAARPLGSIGDSLTPEWEQPQYIDRREVSKAAGPSVPFSARNKKPVTCTCCTESIPGNQSITAPCGDPYCHDCIKQVFLNACTDEELFPPRCCKREIPIESVRYVLSRAETSHFLSKSEEYRSQNRTYCYRSTCSGFIPASSILDDLGYCKKCESATCTMCKKEQHYGDCPEDLDLELTLETAAKNGWQRCRNCHALVELMHGCSHMTCRCKAEWCYACGVTWKECDCGDWDPNQLNRRAEELAIRVARPNIGPQALERRIQGLRDHLEASHECEHTGEWSYSSGGSQCEMCFDTMPRYIFVCAGCSLRACNRCRKNRI